MVDAEGICFTCDLRISENHCDDQLNIDEKKTEAIFCSTSLVIGYKWRRLRGVGLRAVLMGVWGACGLWVRVRSARLTPVLCRGREVKSVQLGTRNRGGGGGGWGP